MALILFPVICWNGLQGLKMDWNLRQQQDTGHTRELTKVWKYLTRDNSTFRECSLLRIRRSFKRFLHCGSKVLGIVQSTKCFVLKWETACRLFTCVVRSFLYLDTDFVDILFRVPQSYLFLRRTLFNVNFRKISVRKTIWDLVFSEHLL